MITIIGPIVIGFVSVILLGIQEDVIRKERAKRIEAERKMNQVMQEREEEMLYDMRTRDQDNIPDDEEWIDRGGDMPAYRNIPDEWRNRK